MTAFAAKIGSLGNEISGTNPTGGVVYVAELAARLADALIEIASAFDEMGPYVTPRCRNCRAFAALGCTDTCPGLIARRALGVA